MLIGLKISVLFVYVFLFWMGYKCSLKSQISLFNISYYCNLNYLISNVMWVKWTPFMLLTSDLPTHYSIWITTRFNVEIRSSIYFYQLFTCFSSSIFSFFKFVSLSRKKLHRMHTACNPTKTDPKQSRSRRGAIKWMIIV